MSVLPPAKIAVGIVVERRKAQSPWIDFTWKPIAALPGQPDALPWTTLAEDGETTTFYAGAAEIGLYRTETATISAPACPCSGWRCGRAASSRRTRFSQ